MERGADRSSDNNTGAFDARGLCEGRVARFRKERDAVATRSRRLSNLRLIVFFLAVVAAIAAVDFPVVRLALSTLAAVFTALFSALVVLFRRAQRELDALEAMVTVNEEARARVERNWDALEVGGEAAAPPAGHPYAEDLDLFGNASLMRLLGSVRTVPGKETLSTWLCEPALPRDLAALQQGVAEVSPLLEFRQQLEAQGVGVGGVSGPIAVPAREDQRRGGRKIQGNAGRGANKAGAAQRVEAILLVKVAQQQIKVAIAVEVAGRDRVRVVGVHRHIAKEMIPGISQTC